MLHKENWDEVCHKPREVYYFYLNLKIHLAWLCKNMKHPLKRIFPKLIFMGLKLVLYQMNQFTHSEIQQKLMRVFFLRPKLFLPRLNYIHICINLFFALLKSYISGFGSLRVFMFHHGTFFPFISVVKQNFIMLNSLILVIKENYKITNIIYSESL